MRTSCKHNSLARAMVMAFLALVGISSARASDLPYQHLTETCYDLTGVDDSVSIQKDTLQTGAVNSDTIVLTEDSIDLIESDSSTLIESATLVESQTVPRASKSKNKRTSLYALPYSMTASDPNWKRLWLNTGALFAAGIATVGILECLPENATAWNKEDRRPLFKRWVDHVTSGPVVDHDKAVFNYILHPYGGAAYYMSARSLGFNVLQSFIYSTAVSTIFWEYGIEGFMEVPSIEDIFITPVVGSALGECFYILKRHIVSNGYTLAGSPVLGYVVAFLVDPVNEFIGYIAGNEAHGLYKRKNKVDYTLSPLITNDFKGMALSLTF